MAAHVFRRREVASVVLFWLEEDYVTPREEEQEQRAEGREANAKAQSYHLVVAAQVNCDECYPNHNCRVHSEADELCLVKVFRNVSRLDCVQSAHCNEEEVKAERRCFGWGGGTG